MLEQASPFRLGPCTVSIERMSRFVAGLGGLLLIIVVAACSRGGDQDQATSASGSAGAGAGGEGLAQDAGNLPTEVVIAHFPIDSLDGVISRVGVSFDASVSSDGKGSVRIDASGPVTVKLFELGDIDLDNTRIDYSAKLRSEGLQGAAYLEMLVSLPGLGEFFSRGFDTAIRATSEWSSPRTPFFLSKGQDPDNIRLNLIITGRGKVWIDDVKLTRPRRP